MASEGVTVSEAKDEAGTKGLEATFDVAVPPDELLAILWDVGNFGRLYPDIKEARVVGGEGDALDVAYRVNAVLKEVSYVLRRTRDPAARVIAWRELSGDLRRVRGEWRIAPSPGDPSRSRVTYRAFVDVGRFVPTAMVRDIAIRKLDEMAARVRRVAGDIRAKHAGGV